MSNNYPLCIRTVQRKLSGAVSCFIPVLDWFAGIRPLQSLRAILVVMILILSLSPLTVQAQDTRLTPEMINDALEGQGYTIQSTTRTLLGRARIVAQQGQIWREVVLDLSTGQILRDYAVEFSASNLPSRQSEVMPRGGRVLSADDLPMLEN